ncbi:MAG: hypothetical protein LBT14_00250 [Treponema sp.]|nr:hypothetical protein [Treponema sp.]
MPLLAQDKSYYTYADVLEWNEDVRAEIIDGEMYMNDGYSGMGPSKDTHGVSLSVTGFFTGKAR